MIPNPFFGVLFHAIGGFAAGSFYIPFKKVRGWVWEGHARPGDSSWSEPPTTLDQEISPGPAVPTASHSD